jgi:hypothetical protein
VYELTPDYFADLIRLASRHHRKQIAEMLSLTAHTRRGTAYLRGPDGAEVPAAEAYRRSQADDQVRRWVYNLWMHYR